MRRYRGRYSFILEDKRWLFVYIIVVLTLKISIDKLFIESNCCRLKDSIVFSAKPNIEISNYIHWCFYRKYYNPSYYTNHYYVNVCKDGEPHEGWYCSTKPCNIFGCNCGAPCYSNDKNLTGSEIFRSKYKEFINIVDD